MRLGIISDLHGNVEALWPVLRALAREAVQDIVCLGDLVGYNAQAREVIALVRERAIASVHGNHDLMVLGRLPVEGGPRARRGVAWTSAMLTPDELMFLRSLPGAIIRRDRLLLVHSVPGDPVTRLRTERQFVRQFQTLRRTHPGVRMCFTGHTHEPGVIEITRDGHPVAHDAADLRLLPDSFYFVNPGSVGEPRGPDSRATFAVYDAQYHTLAFHRVAYDRDRLARENLRRGLLLPELPVGFTA